MIHRIRCVALLAAALFAPATVATAFAATRADAALSTTAERSGFQKTGRYDEVIALCEAFARHYPQAVRASNEGRVPCARWAGLGDAAPTEFGGQLVSPSSFPTTSAAR